MEHATLSVQIITCIVACCTRYTVCIITKLAFDHKLVHNTHDYQTCFDHKLVHDDNDSHIIKIELGIMF